MISRQPCSIADLLLATSLIAVSLRFATANQPGSWIQLFWLAGAVGLGSGLVVGLVYGSVRRALVAGAAGAVGGAALCYPVHAFPDFGRGLLAIVFGAVGSASAAVASRQPATRIITTPAVNCALVVVVPGLLAWIGVFFVVSAECLHGRSLVESFVALVASAAGLLIFSCGALISGAACGCVAWLVRLAADQFARQLSNAGCPIEK